MAKDFQLASQYGFPSFSSRCIFISITRTIAEQVNYARKNFHPGGHANSRRLFSSFASGLAAHFFLQGGC